MTTGEENFIKRVRSHDAKPLWRVVDGRCAACVNTSHPPHGLTDDQLRILYRNNTVKTTEKAPS